MAIYCLHMQPHEIGSYESCPKADLGNCQFPQLRGPLLYADRSDTPHGVGHGYVEGLGFNNNIGWFPWTWIYSTVAADNRRYAEPTPLQQAIGIAQCEQLDIDWDTGQLLKERTP